MAAEQGRLPVTPPAGSGAGVVPAGTSGGVRGRRTVSRWWGSYWVDVIWVVFVAVNLTAMRLLAEWQTVPFLAIWVSLTLIYGFRLWRLQPTILTLAAVTVATGGIVGIQVLQGEQDADYLAEVPMVALMFVVMVWHGRRRLTAMQERLAAMEQVQAVTQENLRLVSQQHQFLQDASHELGTPITVALGHAELLERESPSQEVAADAQVIAGELRRLRRLATRMLLLASAGAPDFLHLAPVPAGAAVTDALERWGHVPRQWRLGSVADVTVTGDDERLAVALDALLENAIAHTGPGDQIEISARADGGHAVLAVADAGCGIGQADLERIVQRLARAGAPHSRDAGGFGLGLAIVQAITEAHHGTVRARSTPGHGSVFELVLPLAAGSAAVDDVPLRM